LIPIFGITGSIDLRFPAIEKKNGYVPLLFSEFHLIRHLFCHDRKAILDFEFFDLTGPQGFTMFDKGTPGRVET
jgi:hypothetical protein